MVAMSYEETAFLFRNHADELRAFFERRVGNRDVAQDLTQEVYLRLLRMDERPAVSNFRAYLFKIAANLAVDHFRAAPVRHDLPQDIAEFFDLSDEKPGPEAEALSRSELALVDEAIAELRPNCRKIFYLSRIDGLTHREIAIRMGLTTRAVEKNIAKALLHCRKRLEQTKKYVR